jgi:hypothetical protein
VAAGCGGDDESAPETPPTLPDLSSPQGERTETTPTVTETTPEPTPPTTETVPPSDGGGAPAPETEPAPDSPENDTAPPADSPAERFEEFCNENPGACG